MQKVCVVSVQEVVLESPRFHICLVGRLQVKGNGLDTPHTGFVTITFSINQNTFTMYDASWLFEAEDSFLIFMLLSCKVHNLHLIALSFNVKDFSNQEQQSWNEEKRAGFFKWFFIFLQAHIIRDPSWILKDWKQEAKVKQRKKEVYQYYQSTRSWRL